MNIWVEIAALVIVNIVFWGLLIALAFWIGMILIRRAGDAWRSGQIEAQERYAKEDREEAAWLSQFSEATQS